MHETSERPAPRLAQRFPRPDVTKAVMPLMSALVLAIGVASSGYAFGVYKTKTESHLENIDKRLGHVDDDLKEIKRLLQKRVARS